MKKLIAIAVAAGLLAGCAGIRQETFVLSDGRKADYIHGKVDADGQTGVFRDAFIDGQPVLSHFGSGQSLTGQILQGAASAALIGGGMVGAAAVLRPTKINETNNLSNDQDQGQAMQQGQIQGQSTSNKLSNTSVNVNSNSNKSTSKSGAVAGAHAGAVAGAHAEGGKASNSNCVVSLGHC